MNDILYCPICNLKLKNKKMNNYSMRSISKTGNFIERTCVGLNHIIQFFTDTDSKKIVFLKTSLNHTYSKFIEVDFHNAVSRILCFKMGDSQTINVPKIIELDFPNLEKLKQKVDVIVTFS